MNFLFLNIAHLILSDLITLTILVEEYSLEVFIYEIFSNSLPHTHKEFKKLNWKGKKKSIYMCRDEVLH
jgi:hypothetical protein